jgi:hypothetical protein
MNNERNDRNSSITIHNSNITLNELSTNRNSSTSGLLKRSNTKNYHKSASPGLKRTRTITIKPKHEKAEEDEQIPHTGRTDIFGNPILKGERVKNYKVTFRDKTSAKTLTEIIAVTSYKSFYNDEDDEDRKVSTRCTCGCSIF